VVPAVVVVDPVVPVVPVVVPAVVVAADALGSIRAFDRLNPPLASRCRHPVTEMF
jgi:hypothetical protein